MIDTLKKISILANFLLAFWVFKGHEMLEKHSQFEEVEKRERDFIEEKRNYIYPLIQSAAGSWATLWHLNTEHLSSKEALTERLENLQPNYFPKHEPINGEVDLENFGFRTRFHQVQFRLEGNQWKASGPLTKDAKLCP